MMPRPKPTPPSRRQRGFVLIYVILMVGALAVLLAAMQRIRPPSSQGIDKQINLALQGVEGRAFMTFILAGMNGEPVVLDPRFEAYQQVLREKQAQLAAADDRIAFLKALLSSLNYDLRISDAASSPTNKPSQTDLKSGTGQGSDGKDGSKDTTAKDSGRVSVPFFPRKAPFTYQLGNTTYQVTVHPTNAKPNLNLLGKEALERYLKYLKVPPERIRTLVGTLIDWIDPDDMTSDSGAEFDHYPNYRPLNGPVRHWAELAYVKDMDASTLRFLRENFSLDGPLTVSADYAPPEMIAALADLPLRTVQVAYEFQEIASKQLPDNKVYISDILLDDELKRFQSVAGWNSYTDVRLIRLAGPNFVQTIRYDMTKKKVLETW